jgi:uncharacterized protein YjaG (DUF416 family)
MGVVAVTSPAYDEATIKARLDALPQDQRVLFACACAERLLPLYAWFASKTGQGDPDGLREALDIAWGVRPGLAPGNEVDSRRGSIEGLVPDDNDADWSVWSPLAQNAAAAVAYSLRTWLSGDSQNGAWAARQLYEAADYLLQLGKRGHAYVEEGEPVSLALRAIADTLIDVAKADVDGLRAAAVADGEALLRLGEEIKAI